MGDVFDIRNLCPNHAMIILIFDSPKIFKNLVNRLDLFECNEIGPSLQGFFRGNEDGTRLSPGFNHLTGFDVLSGKLE